MPISELDYLERFIECSRLVERGKRGAIRDDRFLLKSYDRSFYHILKKEGLDHSVHSVRAETILLLMELRDPSALREVTNMRYSDVSSVSDACVSYLTALKDAEAVKKELFDILEHKNGVQFRNAAMRMSRVATDEDVPALRRIYGQVEGPMRENIKECLTSIISRYPELKRKERYILSIPVFPDERSFDKFMDKSIVYLDIRYRDSIAPRSSVSMRTFNNVVSAIRTMQVRIYNERDNLKWYEPSKANVIKELESLIRWVVDDLNEKDVIPDSSDSEAVASPVVDLLDSSNS